MSQVRETASGKKPAMRRRFQNGNWRCRNGVWICKYREYVSLSDGTYTCKERGKSFPGRSLRAAMAAMQPILETVNSANRSKADEVAPKGAVKLSDVVDQWRAVIAPNRKPRGREAAESNLRLVLGELGSLPLSQLDNAKLQEFVAKITPGRSGKTIENILLTLAGVLGHARKGILGKQFKEAPSFKLSDLSLPGRVKSETPFYEVEELQRLLKAAREP